ncbi:hypothetical protein LEN26_004922 [Aphanomyces euteiches]|nr:hypothetical protein AeMF1_015014 [Aphanomyces euteiches]KAH9117622.1 hypothetical protein LEN26_012551 [Aphanomyces euteiches]KAH9146821.1 hypothetical protein LEN26_004922 [Aphanomyces euteiches]
MAQEQQPLSSLKTVVDGGVTQAQTYLAHLQAQIAEYDARYHVSETASSYLKSTVDLANQAVDELRKSAAALRETTTSTTKAQVELVQAALNRVTQSLGQIQSQAAQYDTKFKVVIADAHGSLEALATKTVDATREAIERAHVQALAVQHHVSHSVLVTAGAVLQQVEAVDARYNLSSTVNKTVQLVAEKALDLDAQYQVTQKAISLDTTVTGGLGQRGVETGKQLVQNGLVFVNDTIQQAKSAHADSLKEPEPEATPVEAPKKAPEAPVATPLPAVAEKEQPQQPKKELQVVAPTKPQSKPTAP